MHIFSYLYIYSIDRQSHNDKPDIPSWCWHNIHCRVEGQEDLCRQNMCASAGLLLDILVRGSPNNNNNTFLFRGDNKCSFCCSRWNSKPLINSFPAHSSLSELWYLYLSQAYYPISVLIQSLHWHNFLFESLQFFKIHFCWSGGFDLKCARQL